MGNTCGQNISKEGLEPLCIHRGQRFRIVLQAGPTFTTFEGGEFCWSFCAVFRLLVLLKELVISSFGA